MAYEPTTGETPLTDAPVWGGRGGGQQAANVYAWDAFTKQFGRNPTQSELTQLSAAYIGGDPNIANVAQGNSAVAQYFNTFSNSPEAINKRNQEKYLKEAPQHFDSINQLFQSKLKRVATQEELDHFGKALASGNTDAYGLSQFLEQQPEFAEGKDKAMREGLRGELAANDKRQFSEQILPGIQETYAKQGRSFDSSAFQNATAQAAQAQNTQREGFLANLTASQYGNRQENAYNDYANAVANQQNMQNFNLQAQYQGGQNMQNRLNQITDYNTQSNAYNQYLAKYGKRNNGLGGAIGGVLGGGIGAYFGGPAGAMAGYQMGSGLGQAAQNSGGSY